MKKIYSALLLLFVTAAIAQIPSGYYNTATGTGYTLKTQLYNLKNIDSRPVSLNLNRCNLVLNQCNQDILS